MIPKVIFQTSKNKPKDNQAVESKFLSVLNGGWQYLHFDDKEIIEFFQRHPLVDFPFIIEKFYSFSNGAHRADLFRYYYLYFYGGVFVDSDAMLYHDISSYCENYQFFSVESGYIKNSLFQGFLGSVAGCPLIYDALKCAYHTNDLQLGKAYHLFCFQLKEIYNHYKSKLPCFLFQEAIHNQSTAKSFDASNPSQIILLHFFLKKKLCL